MFIESGSNLNSRWRQLMAASCLLFGGVAAAQTPGIVRPEAIRAHVEYLADDLLEGRGTGSRGHALAAAYVAAQFKQLGLTPAGDKLGEVTDFLQTVRLLEATPVLPGSAAKWSANGNATTFEYNTDYLPFADYSAPNSTLTAPLAFVGFGITAPEAGYDDLANVDVRDRIAVVLSGAPAKFPSDQRAYYSWSGAKFANLIEHGALGVIVVDTPVDTARTPWDRRVKMSWQPQMRWVNSNDQPVDAYSELKQQFRFNHAAAAKLFQNGTSTLEEAFAAAETGEPQGFLLPGLMTLTSTTGLRRTESHNVVAMLRGTDPQLRRQYIVISAHLDHLGRGAAVNGDAIYNGAHDNATGVGVLLELARSIVASDQQPKRSILFIATTAEEKEQLGAEHFANHPTVPKGSIVANININMPLFLGPTRDFVVVGGRHSTLGAAAQRSVRAQGYVVSADNAPEEVRLIRGDQFAFLKQGIPAVHLSSGYHARVQNSGASTDVATTRQDFLRQHYHQPSDDLSLPIHYASAVDLVQIGARLAIEAANQADRPRFNRGDFFGTKFGTPGAPRPATKRGTE
jgi:Zn-dependent M28 family amino/carboxypeptidase